MSCCTDLHTARVFLDKDFKTCISMRDGFQVYHGSEIGLKDQEYKIYRAPAEILKVFKNLKNIPVTVDHVDPMKPINDDKIVGHIKSAKIVDAEDDDLASVVAVENVLDLSDEALDAIKDGKKELSLGYLCKTRKHDKYDLEQYDIKPHHLAIVSQGRCGDICSIIDFKPLEKAMLLDEFVDSLQSILTAYTDAKDDEKEEKKIEDEDEDEEKSEAKPKPFEAKKDEDEDEEKSEAKKDEAFIQKMVDAEVKRTVRIVEKASQFLPKSYAFTDATNETIMMDAIRTVHPDISLERNEIETAFKMLASTDSKHSNFGENYFNQASQGGKLLQLADKQIK